MIQEEETEESEDGDVDGEAEAREACTTRTLSVEEERLQLVGHWIQAQPFDALEEEREGEDEDVDVDRSCDESGVFAGHNVSLQDEDEEEVRIFHVYEFILMKFVSDHYVYASCILGKFLTIDGVF